MTGLLFLLVFCVGAASAAAEPLATVGNRRIERAAVETVMAGKLRELEIKRYEILKEGVDGLVNEALLELEAADRAISVEDLVRQAIFDKVSEPSEEKIQTLYEEHNVELEGAAMEQVRGRIVDYLRQVELAAKQEALFADLRQKHRVAIALRPQSVAVETGGRVRGPAGAPVTIVEFSDYECPYCKRAEASVRQVLAAYGDRIRFAYRDYPLEFHPHARPAAEAGHCAHAQGKFWEFHEKIMASDDLDGPTLATIAEGVGLDRRKFDACVADMTFAKVVDADFAAGEALGVSGTPVFFINGRMLDGAQPFEAFKKIIDEELSWRPSEG